MRQALLALVLIFGAVAVFSTGMLLMAPGKTAPAAVTLAPLGDTSAFAVIVADVQSLSGTGDLAAAATRITDLETAWDDAEARLRPMDGQAWGRVDDAVDAALKALRTDTPQPSQVSGKLAALADVLDHPDGSGSVAGGAQLVAGLAVTDAFGHPLACEDMLVRLKAAIDATAPDAVNTVHAKEFLAKATERCNADDDARADAASAQGLALVAP